LLFLACAIDTINNALVVTVYSGSSVGMVNDWVLAGVPLEYLQALVDAIHLCKYGIHVCGICRYSSFAAP